MDERMHGNPMDRVFFTPDQIDAFNSLIERYAESGLTVYPVENVAGAYIAEVARRFHIVDHRGRILEEGAC